MQTNGELAAARLQASVGNAEGVGDWFLIDQDRIDSFAEVTEDRQYIHVDPEECARRSPWGVPIAHGFLTLSLLPVLLSSVPRGPLSEQAMRMGINYGFEKVRFISPVKVGSRVRALSTIRTVDLKAPDTVQITRTVSIEIEGETRPALVAEWVTREIYG
jgi:acyl dehydratase